MNADFLVPLLAMVTLLAGLIFAILSAKRTKDQQHDPNRPTSSLGPEGSKHGAEIPGHLE